jgi:hypothetical protein
MFYVGMLKNNLPIDLGIICLMDGKYHVAEYREG